MYWRLAADATLLLHLTFIAYLVFGGFWARHSRGKTAVHLLSVAYGVLIEAVGFTCPLTPLENHFRRAAGQAGFEGGFVEHYLVSVIYPGGLTFPVRVLLTAGLVLINAVAYRAVGLRRGGE